MHKFTHFSKDFWKKIYDYENIINQYLNVDGTREEIVVDKEEYEQLKEDVEELKNLKTQVNNINNNSTEEQVIGTWIDGKKLDICYARKNYSK